MLQLALNQENNVSHCGRLGWKRCFDFFKEIEASIDLQKNCHNRDLFLLKHWRVRCPPYHKRFLTPRHSLGGRKPGLAHGCHLTLGSHWGFINCPNNVLHGKGPAQNHKPRRGVSSPIRPEVHDRGDPLGAPRAVTSQTLPRSESARRLLGIRLRGNIASLTRFCSLRPAVAGGLCLGFYLLVLTT